MVSYRSPLSFLILAALLVSIVNCGGTPYRGNEKYYMVATNINLPYWQAAKAGFIDAALQLGVKAELVGPETYDPQAQREKFQEVLAENPTGILISVADPELMKGDIDAAVAKGIPVVTIDADAPASKRLFFIGTDNYDVGVRAAEVVAQQLKRAGTVVVFTMPGQVNLDDRLRGYKDVFATYPAIRIVETVDIKGEATIAFDRTKEMVTKDRYRMDAFVCLEAISCPEVAEVLNRNNVRDKVVVAMDTNQRTLEWIQKGLIQATIGQRPYTMAYVGLRMMADLHEYPPPSLEEKGSLAPVPTFVDTGSWLVDKGNVAEFLKRQETAQSEE